MCGYTEPYNLTGPALCVILHLIELFLRTKIFTFVDALKRLNVV